MKIKDLWELLSNDTSITNGLLFRRYSGNILPDLYVALQHPEKILCIYVSLSETTEVNVLNFSNLQEIKVELYPSPNEPRKNILVFKLLNFDHSDIFAVLCEDLIASIANETNESNIVKVLLNRFEKWKTLFNKIGLNGLSSEEQRGLFGEIYFLRKFLQTNNDYLTIVNTWIGTEGQIRDFQSKSWAVEVKTTHGNNHQKVNISSERQLDTSNLDYLFLYHISIERQQNSGESLNDIVDSVIEIIREDTFALNKFRSKIYEVGYFDSQRNLYESIGYHIRDNIFYNVVDEFPRIEENEIRPGIGDVKYSIILSQCTPYIYDESNVFNIIKP